MVCQKLLTKFGFKKREYVCTGNAANKYQARKQNQEMKSEVDVFPGKISPFSKLHICQKTKCFVTISIFVSYWNLFFFEILNAVLDLKLN